MNDKYTDTQSKREQEYRARYNEWVSTLSPDELAALLLAGLDSPHIDARGVGAPELDPDRCTDGVDPYEEPEEELEEGIDGISMDLESLSESVRILVSSILESRTPGRQLGILGVAFNIRGRTAARLAGMLGIKVRSAQAAANRATATLRIKSEGEAKVLGRIVGMLIRSKKPLLSVEVLSLVTGIAYDGSTETEIAERHGMTRAAVSKRCVEICKELRLPPGRAMKSSGSRETYSQAQHRRYGNK